MFEQIATMCDKSMHIHFSPGAGQKVVQVKK